MIYCRQTVWIRYERLCNQSVNILHVTFPIFVEIYNKVLIFAFFISGTTSRR